MEANLRDYIERLFAAAPKTRKAEELKDEMRQNLIEKYRDLVAGGMSEESAYNEVIRSIGDINALFMELGDETAAPAAQAAPKYVPGPSSPGHGGKTAVTIVAIVAVAAAIVIIAALIFGFNVVFNKNSILSGMTGEVVDTVRDAVSGSINGSGTFNFGTDDSGLDGAYDEGGAYTVPGGGISSVRVDWIIGGVEILPCNGDEIRFTESRGGASIDAADAVRYGVKNGRLTIQFCASRTWSGIKNFLTFDWNSLVYPKQLIVWIPKSRMASLEKIQVNSVSAAVRLSDLSADELVACSVSGDIDAKGLSCDEIKLESVSGKMSIEASSMDTFSCESTSGAFHSADLLCLEKLSVETISGKAVVSMAAFPEELDISTISGAVELIHPAPGGDGFTLKFDSVSGDLDSAAALESGKAKGSYVYGNGNSDFNVETVSGDLSISQAD